MKISIQLLLISLLFMRCGGNSESQTAAVDDRPLEVQLAERIKEDLENGERNDTCILDPVFGMSRMDVVRYKNKLV